MTAFGSDTLTITSGKPIALPALCVQCGDPTDKTISINIAIPRSPFIALIYLIPIPGKELIALAAEAGGGPKSTKVPYCKACQRPRNRAQLKIFGFFLPLFVILFFFATQLISLPTWAVILPVFLAIASLAWGLFSIRKYSELVPVKISREKNKTYRYEFRSGIYTALAASAGFTHADLTNPLAPRPFPEPLDFTK